MHGRKNIKCLDSIIGIAAKLSDGESEDVNSRSEDFSTPKHPDWL